YVQPSRPWADNYTGRTYPPLHRSLPPSTEILSMGMGAFSHPATLCELARKDPAHFRFVCFALAGGPIALFPALRQLKEAKALGGTRQGYSKRRYRYYYASSRKAAKQSGFGL